MHRIKVPAGEILHPVIVNGLFWTGVDWEYQVILPSDHPEFIQEDNEFKFLLFDQLESI